MTMMQQVVQEEAKPAKKAGNNRKVTQLEDVVESEMVTQQDFSNYKGRKVSVMNEEMEEVKESVRQKENT